MKNETYPFKLQPLTYAYDTLEPFIDKETMYLHHDKHTRAYVDNLNKALENYPSLHQHTLTDLLANLETLPSEIQAKVRNNGGGVYNHNIFFNLLKKGGISQPQGALKQAIDKRFNSFDAFKTQLKEAGLTRFGSGWAFLIVDEKNELAIVSTSNQDIPSTKVKILVNIDVWEHAYYLKYQNRRGEYLENIFNVLDWEKIEQEYNKWIKR